MKNLYKIIYSVAFGLLFISCDYNDLKTSSPELGFNESVAIFQYGLESSNSSKIKEGLLRIKMINFNSDLVLSLQYNINGIKYTDDGNFEDDIAGDGLYTAINKVSLLDSEKLHFTYKDKINFSSDFIFTDSLITYLKDSYPSRISKRNQIQKAGGSISFGCKVRLVTCPETGFWNTCWPLSSPCTCVDFYDCEASIEISFN
jgi:hypothetical protein